MVRATKPGQDVHAGTCYHSRRAASHVAACAALLAVCVTPAHADATDEVLIRRIGATTTITEVSSGLPFPARVDTGATSCSIHCQEIKIKDEADDPKENIGKPVRILIKGIDGQEEWIRTKIVGHVVVRTSTQDDERYKVPLKLRWEDVEKRVLVTLNDRERMKYPLLLGRNFLRGGFVVDVDLDGDH